jgi:hypothetical protein
MDRVLDALLENGPALLGTYLGPPEPQPGRSGPETEAVHRFWLTTGTESEEPAADHLLLEISVGMRFIAENVLAADPNDDHGVWGSDLMAVITLSGDRPDWPLVDRIWSALEGLWPTVPWDGMSGFAIAAETERPLHGDFPA